MAKAADLTKAHRGSASFGATRFADWTDDEMRALRGYKPRSGPIDVAAIEAVKPQLDFGGFPTALDWRDRHAVTAVNNQGTRDPWD